MPRATWCMCEQRLEAAAASYDYHQRTLPGHFIRVGLDVCDNDTPEVTDDPTAQDQARSSPTVNPEPRQSAGVTVYRTSSNTNNDDVDPTSPDTANLPALLSLQGHLTDWMNAVAKLANARCCAPVRRDPLSLKSFYLRPISRMDKYPKSEKNNWSTVIPPAYVYANAFEFRPHDSAMNLQPLNCALVGLTAPVGLTFSSAPNF